MANDHHVEPTIRKMEDFTFFDNLALWYVCNETPPPTLALAFLSANEKVCGSLLGVLDPKRRAYVHELMSRQQNATEEERLSATQGMFLIADGLISRGLIYTEGRFFYGKKK